MSKEFLYPDELKRKITGTQNGTFLIAAIDYLKHPYLDELNNEELSALQDDVSIDVVINSYRIYKGFVVYHV